MYDNKYKLNKTRKRHKNKKKKTMRNNKGHHKGHHKGHVTSIWNSDWKKRNILYPKRKHLKLPELDSILYVNETGDPVSVKEEREEQYTANDFIEPSNTVLELGARYGVVSSVINNKLENPRNHVVLEPDKTVLTALRTNKKTHKAKFRILNGVISEKLLSLAQDGYASQTVEVKLKKDSVKTYTIDEIEKKYDLKFDTLVADCEGCLCDFFEENKEFVEKQLKNVMYESDVPEKCDYEKIASILKSAGFNKAIDGFVSFWKKRDLEENVSNLINVQKKELKEVLKELNKYGRKETHWAWWVFPTELPGSNDPYKTYVTYRTALSFSKNAPREWQIVLDKIIDLIEAKGISNVMPSVDHDRIKFFVKFWKGVDDKPNWLDKSIKRLENIKK